MWQWLLLMLLASLFGIAVSYLPYRYAWLLPILTPFAAVYALIWFAERQVTNEVGAPMREVVYFTLALPAMIVALFSFNVTRKGNRAD
ncbi:hypothetical protein EOE67_10855 [Rheinheimera riviphila]|uniref:Uncharacterized protein n=1 Tax=Rheinheimera riviphila TaxID=1834037 RepID=A0A437QSA8_9GAMM|nr:hypothetical protein [Rheinheimera riviphila]RVU37372.1 hypothetical protein EOE67_10855 [Rheinheimera riviphila]